MATFSAAAAALEAQKGEMLPLDVNAASLGRWGVVKRVPLGPVLAITPFNFPLNLTAHKVAPAIAVGAPVVQKPASKTPLSALALREIVLEAGWPADAYVVLPISGAAAEGLVLDPRLPVVSFTGSGAVGWRLKSLAPKKRVGLELGGNAAVVVHSDADLDDAARRTASGAFSYAGQSCISVQRALVHRPALEAFREKLLAATSALAVGDPLDERTDVGPMIAPAEAARVEAWVAEAVAGGAAALREGTRVGECLHPTILVNTTPSMKVEALEVFAPVVTLNAYDDWEEALQRVNDSKYGLQAGVFTRDLARIQRAFDVLEVGAVLVNDVPTWRADRMPYGGVKESGSGARARPTRWRSSRSPGSSCSGAAEEEETRCPKFSDLRDLGLRREEGPCSRTPTASFDDLLTGAPRPSTGGRHPESRGAPPRGRRGVLRPDVGDLPREADGPDRPRRVLDASCEMEKDPAGGFRVTRSTSSPHVPAALWEARRADVEKTLSLAEKYCIVSKAVKGSVDLHRHAEAGLTAPGLLSRGSSRTTRRGAGSCRGGPRRAARASGAAAARRRSPCAPS